MAFDLNNPPGYFEGEDIPGEGGPWVRGGGGKEMGKEEKMRMGGAVLVWFRCASGRQGTGGAVQSRRCSSGNFCM